MPEKDKEREREKNIFSIFQACISKLAKGRISDGYYRRLPMDSLLITNRLIIAHICTEGRCLSPCRVLSDINHRVYQFW